MGLFVRTVAAKARVMTATVRQILGVNKGEFEDMAGSVNRVIIIGNLGRDPESRALPNGDPVVNLSIATSESWRDKASGDRVEKTEWHRVVVFDERLCDVASKYLHKGSKVYLEGSLQTRKWTDQRGVEKYSTEVVLRRFSSKLVLLDSATSPGSGRPQPTRQENEQQAALDTDIIPF